MPEWSRCSRHGSPSLVAAEATRSLVPAPIEVVSWTPTSSEHREMTAKGSVSIAEGRPKICLDRFYHGA